ncbi:tautomerase family protein [Thalassoglobus sp. JC818]|uniref:tautomerase family protein n=1 Tax=Thalassoglobus sp. JC818 TaxID=3232136 RepID=UPI00345AB2C9
MPHVNVKLWPGKTDQQKQQLADAITEDVMKVLHYGEESVSVAFEEVKASEWCEMVFTQDIRNKPDQLYKQPGYGIDDL